jgi:hypothetical protein
MAAFGRNACKRRRPWCAQMKTMAQATVQSGSFSVVLPTLAAMLCLVSLVALITGIALAFPDPMWKPMWDLNREAYVSFRRIGPASHIFLFSLAGISGAAAVGLLLHRRWAWWIALLLFAVNGAGDVVSLVHTGDVLRFGSGVAIASGFVVMLLLPAVRRTVR